MTQTRRQERNLEMRLNAWVKIHERLAEEERSRENETLRMPFDR